MLRVLLIAPEIPGLPRLAQTSELTRIGDVPGVSVTSVIGTLVTSLRIQSQLRRGTFDVLLWSGHGTDGHLLLPDGSDAEPRWLASEVRQAAIKTVVLAVCDSAHRRGLEGFVDVLPAAGINCIGMSIEVADTAAVAYDVALVQALAGGETLREAHRIGIEAIGGRADMTAPQLYPADNTSASLREQVATIQERVTSGDNAEALDLARKFVTELEAVQRDVKSNTQRIAAIEQRISPPWATRALQVSAVAAIIAVLILIVFDETRLIIYSPLWNGVIIDILFVGWALLAWQLAINIRERKK